MQAEKSIEQNDTQQRTMMMRSDVIERNPSLKLSITDRIHSFDYLSWSALVLMFTSIWQIAIPFSWVDAGTEKWLGYISIFILIYSVVILAWAKHNHSVHKDFYAKSLLKHRNQNIYNSNPTSQQELIRPSTVLDFYDDKLDDEENEVEIAGIDFARFSFILSLMLIIMLSGLLVGNEIFEGYFKAIEEANNIFLVENDSSKMTSILLLSQTLCTILSILNLLYIVYEIAQLCLYPNNFSAFINYFLCAFCCISTTCFLFHIYLQDYIKNKKFNTLKHEGYHLFQKENEDIYDLKIIIRCITQIGIISFISGVVSFLFMFYNFFNTRSKKPNQGNYLWFTIIYFVVGGVIFAQSLIIYMDVKNSYSNFHGNCVETVRDYSMNYLEAIGCPQKYFKSTYLNKKIFDMNCSEEFIGLVWEDDLSKVIGEKQNNRSCLNVSCCKLIGEFSAVQFWTFLILSTSLCANSIVIFFFSLIIYTQKEKYIIRVSTKILSSSRFAAYVIFILTFVSIASLGYFFVDIQGITVPPKRPDIPFSQNSTSAIKQQPILPIYYDLTGDSKDVYGQLDSQNKTKSKVYEDIIPQSQIKGCKKAIDYLQSPIEFEEYESEKCFKDNQYNSACSYHPGYHVCLSGINGAFSLSPTFQSKTIRIVNFLVWDPYRIVRGKEGQIQQDELCFIGLQEDCHEFISDHLYFCVNEKLTDEEIVGMVTLKSLQEETLKFPSMYDPVSILANEDKDSSTIESLTHSSKMHEESHEHNEHNNGEKKETKQEDHITLYEAGDEDWVNISITTFGAENGVKLAESEILVFPNTDMCEYHNFETHYPIRRQLTEKDGTSLIYNLPWGKDYAIHYRHDDYLYNCLIFNSENSGRGTTFSIQAPLVYKFRNNEQFKVLLQWSTPILTLRLSGTFNVGDTFQCQVGFYQTECGGMKSYYSPNQPSQVVTIDEIGQYEYLFYVEHIIEYINLRNIQDFEDIEILNEDKLHLKQLNQLFYKSGATVKIYVKERILPVSEYLLPTVLASKIMRQRRPVWLSLCMDGKIGSVSQTPLNKYWEKVQEPKNYWESKFGNQTLPDSRICQKFYKSQSIPQ